MTLSEANKRRKRDIYIFNDGIKFERERILKLIDEKQNIKNLKPASKPEDVIYNCGVFDGLQKVKDELKK